MKNRVALLAASVLVLALPAFAQRPEDRRPNEQRGEEQQREHGPNAPRANQGRIPDPPHAANPALLLPSRIAAKAGASTPCLTCTTISGMATTNRTTSAITWTIRLNMGISNTSVSLTVTKSNDSTVIAVFSGFPVAFRFRSPRGTGTSLPAGAGTATVMTLSCMKTPTMMAGICSTAFTPANTFT
jgi:hypothetical protein